MDWINIFCIAIIVMLALFFSGLPVFVTFLLINIAGIFILIGTSGFGLFANSLYQTATQTSLAAVPLFILMGEILFRSGAIDELINSVDRLVGKIMAIVRIMPFSLVIFFVMGLIMLGIATPSESAATGVMGALFTALMYKKLSVKMFVESIYSSVTITAVLMVILISSKLFGQLLSFMGASSGLMEMVTGLNLSASWMFLVLMLVPFFLCMFIDLFAIMMVAIPIYLPLLKVYGYDPVWFWMLFLINIVLGSMTPPFGYTLFSLKGAAPDVSLSDIYIGAWPMIIVFLIGMGMMFFFPQIVTFLPSLF